MPRTITVHIQRQDTPDSAPYTQTFAVPYEKGLNITSVLQRIAADPVTIDGERVAPVAYDACCLEEVCGACSMVINGHVRQACSALVDALLEQEPEIRLQPMSKFPVNRDLFVDRSRLFKSLKRVKAWAPVEDYSDRGPGPGMLPKEQEEAYPLARCMSCGCCLEACPQFNDKIPFVGPHALGQTMLFNTIPHGQPLVVDRLDVMAASDGITACGNAQNCAKVCPKGVPLLQAIAWIGRKTTNHALRTALRR